MLSGLFAALYAVTVILLAPISFELFQVRIADTLLPLSIIFGLPAVIGVTLGTIVGNSASPLGAIDIIGGTAANFIASFAAWKIGSKNFRGSWITAIAAENLVVTVIVGTYLSYLIGIPLELGLVGVFIGSLIAMNLFGYILLKTVKLRLSTAQITGNRSK
ncbi:MAG: QueT transporter family protein [Nitrososphaerales archaeon]